MHTGVATDIEYLNELFVKLDQDHSGTINFPEFSTAMSEVLGQPTERFRPLFEAMDLSKSGRILYSEFLVAAARHSASVEEDDIQTAFHRLDVDSTGVISFDNLKAVMPDDVPDVHIEHVMSELDGYELHRSDSSTSPAPADSPTRRLFLDVGVDLPTFRRLMRHPFQKTADRSKEVRRPHTSISSSIKRPFRIDSRDLRRGSSSSSSTRSPDLLSPLSPGLLSPPSWFTAAPWGGSQPLPRPRSSRVQSSSPTGDGPFDAHGSGGGDLDRARSLSYQDSILAVKP